MELIDVNELYSSLVGDAELSRLERALILGFLRAGVTINNEIQYPFIHSRVSAAFDGAGPLEKHVELSRKEKAGMLSLSALYISCYPMLRGALSIGKRFNREKYEEEINEFDAQIKALPGAVLRSLRSGDITYLGEVLQKEA